MGMRNHVYNLGTKQCQAFGKLMALGMGLPPKLRKLASIFNLHLVYLFHFSLQRGSENWWVWFSLAATEM